MTILSTCTLTFVDLGEISIGPEPPLNPIHNQLWFCTKAMPKKIDASTFRAENSADEDFDFFVSGEPQENMVVNNLSELEKTDSDYATFDTGEFYATNTLYRYDANIKAWILSNDYSDALKDYMDNLIIEGRNLLSGTEISSLIISSGEEKYGAEYFLVSTLDFYKHIFGSTLTFAFDWEFVGDNPNGTLIAKCNSEYYRPMSEEIFISNDNYWGTSAFTVNIEDLKVNDDMTDDDLNIEFDKIGFSLRASGSVKVTHPRLFFGEKDLGWTQAPEDLEEKFTTIFEVTKKGIYMEHSGQGSTGLVDINNKKIKISAPALELEGYTTINEHFKVLPTGDIEGVNAKFTGSVTSGGSISGTDITGSTVTGTVIQNAKTNPTFKIDANGNINGGSININNNFTVDSTGKVKATGAEITGKVTLQAGSTVPTNYLSGELGGINLLNKSNDFSDIKLFSDATVTKTYDIVVAEWGGKKGTRLVTSGGTHIIKMLKTNSPTTYWPTADLYTMSMWVKNNSTTTIVRMEANGLNSLITNNSTVNPGESKRIVITGSGNTVGAMQFNFNAPIVNSIIDITVGYAKVEKGTIATDWSPSPQDIDSQISDVAGALSTLDTGIKSAFGDGIINDAEAKAIASNIQTLTNERKDVDSEYLVIYNNTNLSNDLKNSLSSIKSAYDSAHDSLISCINNAIADKIITDDERNSVNSFFDTYRTKLGDYKQKVQEALDFISTNKINNIKIGGRNLLRKGDTGQSSSTATLDEDTNTWTITAPAGNTNICGLYTRNKNVLIPYGKTLIVSFDIKVPIACSWTLDVNNYPLTGAKWSTNDHDYVPSRKNSATSLPADEWVRCWFMYTNAHSGNTNKVELYDATSFGLRMTNQTENIVYQVKNIKSEIGNIPTEWTPAPEDLESRVKTAEMALTQDGLKTIIGNTYTTPGDIENTLTSKGYATQSDVTQSSNALELKFSESGGYNLLYNGDFKDGLEMWQRKSGSFEVRENTGFGCPNRRALYAKGSVGTTRLLEQVVPLEPGVNTYTFSCWMHTSEAANGTTNPYYGIQLVVYYTDGTITYIGVTNSVTGSWQKLSTNLNRMSGKLFDKILVQVYNRDTEKISYVSQCMLEKGKIASEYSPNPNEVFDGVTKITKDGVKVTQSNISGYTEMSADKFVLNKDNTDVFRVDNNGAYFKGKLDVQSTIGSTSLNTVETSANRVSDWTSAGKTTIDGGKITANSIMAEKIAVGDFTNICQIDENRNPVISSPILSTSKTSVVTLSDNRKYFSFGDNTTAGYYGLSLIHDMQTINIGDTFRFSCMGSTTCSSVVVTIRVIYTDNNYTDIVSAPVVGTSTVDTMSAIVKISTSPNPAKIIRTIVFSIYNNNKIGITNIRNISINRMSTGELIVDGAITTEKITTNGIDAEVIKTGTLDANRIGANSITANQIAIGDFANYASDPNFENNIYTGFGSWSISTAQSHSGTRSLKLAEGASGNTVFALSGRISVRNGDKFYVEWWGYRDNANQPANINLSVYNADGTSSAFDIRGNISMQPTATNATWIKYSYVGTIDTDGYANVYAKLRAGNALTGNWYFDDILVRKMTAGELIVDGAITADKIYANTITGDKISAGTITADKLKIQSRDSFSINPYFSNWTSTYPYGTAGWTDGGISKVVIDNTNVAQFTVSTATSQQGMHLGVDFFNKGLSLDGMEYIGLEVKFRLTSGTNPAGACMYLDIYYFDNSYDRLGLSLKSIYPTVTTNTWYTAKKVFKVPNTQKTFKQVSGYLLANYQYETNTVKTIQFSTCNAYACTEQDYLTQTWADGTEINGNSIKTGTIVADKIAANSITASKMAIGDFTNLCGIHESHNTDGYTVITHTDNRQYFRFGNPTTASYNRIVFFTSKTSSFNVGDSFKLRYTGWAASATGANFFLRAFYTDATYTNLGMVDAGFTTTNNEKNVRLEVTATPTAGKTISSIQMFIDTNNVAGYFYMRDISIVRMMNGELIVGGSIVSDMIHTNGISADKIKTGSITSINGISNINLDNGSMLLGSTSSNNSYFQWTGTDLNIKAKSLSIGTSSVATTNYVDLSSDALELKFTESGGYNLLSNGNFKRGSENWEVLGTGWANNTASSSPIGYSMYVTGALATSKHLSQVIMLERNQKAYTISGYLHTSTGGADGTTNPFRKFYAEVMYTDNSIEYIDMPANSTLGVWQKISKTVYKPSSKSFGSLRVYCYVRDTTKEMSFSGVQVEKGEIANDWTPNPNEIYSGITTIDKDGITVTQSTINGYASVRADGFFLNKGGIDVFKVNSGGAYFRGKIAIESTIGETSANTVETNAKRVGDWTTTGTTTINGGKITTNSITATQIAANTITAAEIAANTITANKMAIGDFTNLCGIHEVGNPEGNTVITHTDNMKYFRFGNASTAGYYRLLFFSSKTSSFNVGDYFKLRYTGWCSGATSVILTLRAYYTDGTYSGLGSVNCGFTTTNGEKSAIMNITAGPTAGKTLSVVEMFAETSNVAGYFYMRDISVIRMTNGELIVNGSITTDMIHTSGLNADVIKAGYIKAAQINADTLYGKTLTAGTISGGTVSGANITGGNINISSGKFIVDASGNVTTAGNVTLGGTITASGNITATNLKLNGGSITLGTTFSVTSAGAVTATSGTIGGMTLSGSSIYYGTNSMGSTAAGIYLGRDGFRQYTSSTSFVNISGGKITAKGAEIAGDISANTFSSSDGSFQVLVDGSVESLSVNNSISSRTLSVEFIDNPKYPSTLDGNIAVSLNSSVSSSATTLEDGAVFKTLEDLEDVFPRGLNGYAVTIDLDADYNGNLNFDFFNTGTCHINLNKFTVKGWIHCYGPTMRYSIYGNNKSTTGGTTNYAKVMPSLGYEYSDYNFAIYADYTNINIYDVDVYKGSSSATTHSGICISSMSLAYISNIRAINSPTHLVRTHSSSQVYIGSSAGTTSNNTFSATSGSIQTISPTNQAGRTSGNVIYTSGNAQIFSDGATFSTTPLTGTNGSTAPATTKTVTIKSNSGDTYRNTVYNNWKNDGTVRQGDYGYGDCTGCWFFGTKLYDLRSKNITAVSITITRQSGGTSSAISHGLKMHTYASRPGGAPSFLSTFSKSFSLAVGNSTTFNLSSAEIAVFKTCKGFGLVPATQNAANYSVCSGTMSVKITYTE